MDLAPEDLRHRLHQLRSLATETDDPLAERLVWDLIVELEDRLTAEPSPVKYSLG
jgi:SpoVK/Ycf46/Vps4 family AAA+-type ATPase